MAPVVLIRFAQVNWYGWMYILSGCNFSLFKKDKVLSHFLTTGNQNASNTLQSDFANFATWFCLATLALPLDLYKAAERKTMMGMHEPMGTVVPTFLCSVLLWLKNIPTFRNLLFETVHIHIRQFCHSDTADKMIRDLPWCIDDCYMFNQSFSWKNYVRSRPRISSRFAPPSPFISVSLITIKKCSFTPLGWWNNVSHFLMCLEATLDHYSCHTWGCRTYLVWQLVTALFYASYSDPSVFLKDQDTSDCSNHTQKREKVCCFLRFGSFWELNNLLNDNSLIFQDNILVIILLFGHKLSSFHSILCYFPLHLY